MPERPDLRQIAASLRESVGVLDREALVEVLTYVLNEYVVEGPPPLAAAQVERLEDLAGLSLAGLISALQVRLDVAGLELFRVEGDEVRVQTPGGWVALQPGRSPTAQAPERASPPPAAGPEGRAGARFIEQPMTRPSTPPPAPTGRAAADEALSRGRGDLIGAERGVVTPPAPRPRSGLSISGRPTATASTAPPPAAPPSQAQPAQGQPAQGQPAQPRPEPAQQPTSDRKEDDASIRFSLLELD